MNAHITFKSRSQSQHQTNTTGERTKQDKHRPVSASLEREKESEMDRYFIGKKPAALVSCRASNPIFLEIQH